MIKDEEDPSNLSSSDQEQNSKCVLIADVNQIKHYLFASTRLRQIVNASALLSYVNILRTKEIVSNHSGDIIISAGGNTQAIFEGKDCLKNATSCKAELERIYPSETGGATVSVAIEKVENDDVSQSIRKALIQVGNIKNGIQSSQIDKKSSSKDENSFNFAPSQGGSPYFRIDDQTGQEYAVVWEKPQKESDEETFGSGSWKQHSWEPAQFGLSAKAKEKLLIDQKLRLKLEKSFPNLSLRFPTDFDELTSKSDPHGYMGFINADGNGFGDCLSRLSEGNANSSTYTEFSNILESSTEEAYLETADFIISNFLEKPNNMAPLQIIPIRVLLLGGDDLILATLPQLAIPFANEFCRRFQSLAAEKGKDIIEKYGMSSLTMSAGVVIAGKSFPFLSYYQLSSSLLKSAKKRVWKAKKLSQNVTSTEKEYFGAVDFQVITASSAESLSILREKNYVLKTSKNEISLTGRPYLVHHDDTKDELLQLRKTIYKLKRDGVSRGQIKALNDILRQNPQKAQLDFWYWIQRLSSKKIPVERMQSLKMFLSELVPSDQGHLLPWPFDTRVGNPKLIKYTPYLDLVELFDLPDDSIS